MRTLALGLLLLVTACSPRHAAVTTATPIGTGGSLIGNDGGSLIGNDGASLIGNDGASKRPAGQIGALDAAASGKLTAPRAADAVDATDTLITLGAGTGSASTSLAELPVVGATVTVREVRNLVALGLDAAISDKAGHFAVGARATGANLLFEASGSTSDGKTLRLLGLFGKDESVAINLASTLAAVRALRPGKTAGVKRAAVQVGSLRAAISTALAAHPAEARRAALLLAADDNSPFATGSVVDLEDALVGLGRVDAALQAALDKLDAGFDAAATASETASASASDKFAAAHP
ncbi:MAG: hypothetical protein JWM80_4485 [Cyanobacteria bacterium RYN_339]|nr:hypothetical protein [Cyanobacteria bacterium RYN_339]